MRELELKEQSLKLSESLLSVANDTETAAFEGDDQNEVDCLKSPVVADSPTKLDHTQTSRWIQLLGNGLKAEPHHLCNAEKGAEFACVHNHDSLDFMNNDKFQHFILRKTKANELYEWDLLDEI